MIMQSAAIKAALVAAGVSAAAAGAAIKQDAPMLPDAPPKIAVHHLQKPNPKMTQQQLLLQIDERLQRIEEIQTLMLRGYMNGGVYR